MLWFTFACWFAAMCSGADGFPGNAFMRFLGCLFGATLITATSYGLLALINLICP